MSPVLVTLPDGRQLGAAPAASLERMSAARGRRIMLTSAYRPPAEQARLRALWEAGRWPNFVARPENSDHCRGLAIDVDDDTDPDVRAWMALHAAEFGWRRTDPTEWWHYVYFPDRDRHTNQEDDMFSDEDRQRLQNAEAQTTTLLKMFDATGELRGALHSINLKTDALPALIAASDGGDVDTDAIAAEVAALLPTYTVTITPREG